MWRKGFILPAGSSFGSNRFQAQSCPIVEKLCMNRAKPVEKLTADIFLRENPQTIAAAGLVDAVFAPRFA
jgi:hypothetical protein